MRMTPLREQMRESRLTEGSIPWREQEFGDARGTWKVGDLHDHADGLRSPRPIPISQLAPNNLESGEQHTTDADQDTYERRAWESDIETPIIAVRYPDGLWIADGTHRTWKARELGRRSINGWILDWEEILDIAHGPPHAESATSPY
jgi:hypothetical protein